METKFLNQTSEFNQIIKDFAGGNNDVVNKRLFDLYNNNLQKAVRQSFNDNSEWMYKFDANVSKFAAYKANYVGNTLRKALEAKPKEFDVNAKRIISTFNRFQLTEYNTTVALCRSTRQMMQFKKTEGEYPNIEWILSRSAQKRELHLSYVGLVLPIGHPFWRTNQPGSLYNCKCDWRKSKAAVSEIPAEVENPKGLEKNPRYTGVLFGDKHPYFSKATETKEIDQAVSEYVFSHFKKQKSGYFVHPLQKLDASDYNDLKLIATSFKKMGADVYIMPKLANSVNDLHYYLFGINGGIGDKCADLLVGDYFIEFESFTTNDFTKKTISNMIGRAVQQADRIIIDIRNSGFSFAKAKTKAMNRLRKSQEVRELYFLTEDGLVKIF